MDSAASTIQCAEWRHELGETASLVDGLPGSLHPEQMRRHEVKAGFTGWAQVNGRSAITWEQKSALDVWYVDRWSLWLDLKIVALTLWQILIREGISQPGYATAEEFVGRVHASGPREQYVP